MRIAVVGPVSAAALADLVHPIYRDQALCHPANHGTPVGALVRQLVESGHHVSVVSHRRGHDEMRMSGPNIEFFQAASRASPRQQILDGFRRERRAMVAHMRNLQVDLVHAHWTYEWALAAAEANIAPLVVTVHDAPLTVLRRNRGLYWLGRFMLGARARLAFRGARLTAVSPIVAKRFRREMLWRDEIEIVPNCVDLDAPRQVGEVPTTTHATIAEIADGSRLKNVRRLLQAFKAVRLRIPAASLVLIGPELSSDSKISAWAQRQGLSDSVTFEGQLDRQEVRQILESSTVHAHASREESFGLSVLEAMALGIPVVAGKGSGGPEWLLAEGAGVIADTTNPQAFAQEIIALLLDEGLRTSVASIAANRFNKVFQPSAVARLYEDVYRRAVSEAMNRTGTGR